MLNSIVMSVCILGVLGLTLGAMLGYAAKKFAPDVDPRVAQIRDCLPGLNCGACGFAGCDAYAQGVVNGAPCNKCLPGGPKTSQKITAVLNGEVQEQPSDAASAPAPVPLVSMLMERLKSGIVTENPIFIQVIGTCPLLAISSTVENAIGMGIASTVVLMGSNAVVAAIRKLIPDQIRIPAFIIVIAAFVTVVHMLMRGYLPALNQSLGIFIPLIVVNCIILGRAEAYASKNGVVASIFDALGMGLGFMVALLMVSSLRELFGSGTLLGYQVMPSSYPSALLLVLAPGAFLIWGLIMGGLNAYNIHRKKPNPRISNPRGH